jgi:hypothetical protein
MTIRLLYLGSGRRLKDMLLFTLSKGVNHVMAMGDAITRDPHEFGIPYSPHNHIVIAIKANSIHFLSLCL